MNQTTPYIIRGGDPGVERLAVLARVMRPGSQAVLERAGIAPGINVLDLGCGSGDMTVEIARMVGPTGRVVAIDNDDRALDFAKSTARSSGLDVEWRNGCVEDLDVIGAFDLVYARFILSHLNEPATVLRLMRRALRPSGKIVLEDIDISVHAHWPVSPAFQRYVEIYAATARARGAMPCIGPSLATLLVDAGLENVEVAISMPVFRSGEGKTIARLTLLNIADAAIAAGLSHRDEIDRLLAQLADHEFDPRSIQSTAQVFQVIGQRPADDRPPNSENFSPQ